MRITEENLAAIDFEELDIICRHLKSSREYVDLLKRQADGSYTWVKRRDLLSLDPFLPSGKKDLRSCFNFDSPYIYLIFTHSLLLDNYINEQRINNK